MDPSEAFLDGGVGEAVRIVCEGVYWVPKATNLKTG